MYTDPRRKQGSQQEVSRVKQLSPTTWVVSGYHNYQLSYPTHVTPKKQASKYAMIFRHLQELQKTNTSLVDLGCANGLICFLAKEAGFSKVLGLDHDVAYINQLTALRTAQVDWKSLEFKQFVFKLGNLDAKLKADVAVAGALVHWLYSATAGFGSLKKIIQYLSEFTKNAFLVEWVAPNDPAIRQLGHIRMHPEYHTDPYSHQHFIEALTETFGKPPTLIHKFTSTRWLYKTSWM